MYLNSFKKIVYENKEIEYAARIQANKKIENPGVFQTIFKFAAYRDFGGSFSLRNSGLQPEDLGCPPAIYFQREIVDNHTFKNLTETEARECLYLADNFNLFETYSLDGDLNLFIKEPFFYQKDRRETVQQYYDETNMSYAELKAWSETKDSKKAGFSKDAINRNLYLMGKSEDHWDAADIINANKTINFIKRAKKVYNKKITSLLKNWGFKGDGKSTVHN